MRYKRCLSIQRPHRWSRSRATPRRRSAFVIGQLAADEAEILSIGVSPNWQRAGLGTGLFEGLTRAARRGDAKRIFLEVADDNAPALALYRKLGFVENGRRKRYYERPGGEAARRADAGPGALVRQLAVATRGDVDAKPCHCL